MTSVRGHVVVAGTASGAVVALDMPLSFWGGFDIESGRVIDEHHPQRGVELGGRVVVLPAGRGSSSASSVLAEAARVGTAPAALLMLESDEIIATGAIVADELYDRPVPVLVLDADSHRAAAAATSAFVEADGTVLLEV